MNEIASSTLYVVATPIGNLQDLTARAVSVLGGVSVVYAEDTRVSRVLLDRYGIKTPLRSYREAATPQQVGRMISDLLTILEEGGSVAYVSDAGTPGISDPGSFLVGKAASTGFPVVPVPGPSALAALLSVAGLPVLRPLFVGFMPKKKGHQTLMAKLRTGLVDGSYDAIIWYESPERILRFLAELDAWELPLQLCLGREITKLHEEILRGSVAEVAKVLGERSAVKGEISLLAYYDA